MKNVVLDSWAVIALLFDEQGADEVEEFLSAAAAADRPVSITSVNWSEVLYISLRRNGVDGFAKAREFARTMPLDIVPVDVACAEAASEFKAAHRLSLADAFAAGLARIRKAELVTGDPEFASLKQDLKIRWLRS